MLTEKVEEIAKLLRDELEIKCWCKPDARCHNCCFLEAWIRKGAAWVYQDAADVLLDKATGIPNLGVAHGAEIETTIKNAELLVRLSEEAKHP